MQLAKTSAKLAQLEDAGVPFIAILTDPTTGGTTASFAMLGDVQIAEPGALIGFAGQRVIKQTIGQDLPDGFQTAEFVQEHGFIDMIVHRHEMRETLARLLRFFGLLPTDELMTNNQSKTDVAAETPKRLPKPLERLPKRKITELYFHERTPKILVTNDDGIFSHGIWALCNAMKSIGEPYVVAPDSEKSAVGHAITLSDPLRVAKVERHGEFFRMVGERHTRRLRKIGRKRHSGIQTDLVVSGINQGSNAAVNVIYSGQFPPQPKAR